jgi:ATP-binding cassette subfamily F protein 3
LVTAYARQDDIGVSDQDARSVLGRLGLQGDKALRQVQELSGGEKARVALGMFAMKASNVILLDEPSNHLDVECIEALSEGLSDWGQDDGAVVVISHDQAFCKAIPFTHVGTVENGVLTVEQRDTRPNDWSLFEGATVSIRKEEEASSESEANSKPILDREKQKQAYNAPKRIAKIETLIEKAESRIEELDAEMFAHGSDVDKLTELSAKREEQDALVTELMEEWEELEELLAILS